MYRKLIFLSFSLIFIITCTKDKGIIDSGYPPEISKIIVNKCATAGCHTQTSKEGAAGLSLETWDQLFEGDRNGAACIPYSHEYSTLFLFTNTYADLGVTNTPTMPYNKPVLSREEVITLRDWIDAGAPNSAGEIAFSGNANRKKVYVTNRGCDVVTVFDAATRLQMRFIEVGGSPQIESPHMVKVSPDGKYWYVVFSDFDNGGRIQKFNAVNDEKVSELILGSGRWSNLSISSDSQYGFAVDWDSDGKIAYIDLDQMTLLSGSPWPGFYDAYGCALNTGGDTLYVAASSGNYIHKVPVFDHLSAEKISLNPPQPWSPTSLFNPFHIALSPDNQYYYVTCQESNEVRVMRVSDDTIHQVIQTGSFPQEMCFSKTKPYLFVTCELDSAPPGTSRGSVCVIDYTSNTVIATLRLNMSEPHGIAVDDVNGLVYVANRNLNAGFDPHHLSNCGGTNGFVSFIDLNTLQVISEKRIEVATDPYSVAVR